MVGLITLASSATCRPRYQRAWAMPSSGFRPHMQRHHQNARLVAYAAEEIAPEKVTDDDEASLESEEDKSEEYTDVMQQRMGTTLTYRHEDGMNYNRILDDLIVGSCLQTPDDADRLAEKEEVRTVLSLQEDSDMAYFDLDLAPIKERITESGIIAHNRFPIRDFDPFSLRMRLPGAVALLESQAQKNGGTAYVHCTAGLGRAPATALAWMWWVKGIPLEEAFEKLRSIRPCSPRLLAIRQAAVDMLYGSPPTPVTVAVWRKGMASSVQVAGLDVGWGQQVDLQLCPKTKRFVATRNLPPGSYQFKFIVDGRWTYSADHHTTVDGGNTNNCVEVLHSNNTKEALEGRRRLLAEGGQLTEEERKRIVAQLKQIAAASGDNSTISGSAPTPA